MIATSQPSASLAGLQIMSKGGNAVDAAVAAAAVLCVSEPMSTGLGGDAFAIVRNDSGIYGMDASGPAPASAPRLPVPGGGPGSCVVPGAVAGWDALIRKFGRLELDVVLGPAIDLARSGVAAGFHCSNAWMRATRAPIEFGPAPRIGQSFTIANLAESLREIADGGPQAFYRGRIAHAIASATWLDEEDLATYPGARWVEPLSTSYRGVSVYELPPPTQGVAALEGLALLQELGPSLTNQVRAVALALEDAFDSVRDGSDVSHLLSPEHLQRRLRHNVALAPELRGGTVYLSCVDDDGMAVSFIQSIFEPFGSGVVAPGTGIVLNNRAACFEVGGEVVPGRRPYHTIIPGMLDGTVGPRGPFGVMGGFIQAQAHVQLVSAIVDDECDPQEALDRPRFRIEQNSIHLEEGLWPCADELQKLGHTVVLEQDRRGFGGGQVILIKEDHLLGGSDPRKDGVALGY
jgi:gamma-glutamyltranspeptidase/glutathione hydrolase